MSDAGKPNTEQIENQWPVTSPDEEELFKKHRNFAGLFKTHLEPLLGRVPLFAQGPTPETDRARFDRIFRPWPKWVFRLSAELWHVDCPTIDREVFFQTFRVINVLVFRLPTDPESYKMPTSGRDVWERVDFRVVPLIMAAAFGHFYEHIEASREKLDDKLSKAEISPEEHKRIMAIYSPDKMNNAFRELLGNWSKDVDLKPFELMRKVEEARRKTFDKHGLPKETPLIPIYRVMLHNWITIENMSGPKELAIFLTPHLKGKSKSGTGELTRIATLCSRLGLKFRAKSRTFQLQRRDASV